MRLIFLCTAIVGALIFQTGSAWATKDVRLTSVKGVASTSTGALASHAELGDDEPLGTDSESGCSILLDQNAVVELCGQTRISFATDARRGNRIVNVESGSLRMFVEPREPGERIEIHTPAAIATILGTIIYVTVDPVTGESTFTSSDSKVNVRDRDEADCSPVGLPPEAGTPECAAGTTIGSLEQLTVTSGGKIHKKVKVSERELAALGGCLLDFHDLAAAIDRMPQEIKATNDIPMEEVALIDSLPPVSLGNDSSGTGDAGDTRVELNPLDDRSQEEQIRKVLEDDGDPDVELDPFDDPSQEEQIREMFEMEMDPCGSFPSELCNR